MSDETQKSMEVEFGLPVIEIINEYSRLVSSIKKNHRRGKKLACLSSLAAIKPLHSHLIELFVNEIEARENDNNQTRDTRSSQNFFGYL